MSEVVEGFQRVRESQRFKDLCEGERREELIGAVFFAEKRALFGSYATILSSLGITGFMSLAAVAFVEDFSPDMVSVEMAVAIEWLGSALIVLSSVVAFVLILRLAKEAKDMERRYLDLHLQPLAVRVATLEGSHAAFELEQDEGAGPMRVKVDQELAGTFEVGDMAILIVHAGRALLLEKA